MKKIQLHYSEKLLKKAVNAFFFRAVTQQLDLAFYAALLLLILFTFYFMVKDRSDWFSQLLFSSLLFICILFLVVYVAHYRNSLGRLRRMRSPEATFSYDEQEFTLASELGSATMPWSSIREIWQCSGFWLLVFSPGQFVTLPLENVDEETKAFISRKICDRQKAKSS